MTKNGITMIVVSLLFIAALQLACSQENEPVTNPPGIVVWADDCSSIACAINNYDINHNLMVSEGYVSDRYDIKLYTSDGTFQKTIVANRKIDGEESSVGAIYFMKTRGYLLTKAYKVHGGGTCFEKITLDGAITRLGYYDVDASGSVSMIPSLRGTYFARINTKETLGPFSTGTVTITFLDSTGMNEMGDDIIIDSEARTLRWLSDSIFEASGMLQRFVLQPSHSVITRTDSLPKCIIFQTSSSPYCTKNGNVTFIRFINATQTILFDSTSANPCEGGEY